MVNLILKIRFGSTIECVWPKLRRNNLVGIDKKLKCISSIEIAKP